MRHDLRNLLHNFGKVASCGVETGEFELLTINFTTAKALGPHRPTLAARPRRRGDRMTLSQCGNLGSRNDVLGQERSILGTRARCRTM